jgi:hypothetical protein
MRMKIVLKRFLTVCLTAVGAAFLLNGCALLAAPAVGETGTALGSTGSGVSGLLNAESTSKVDDSFVKNNNAQARYYREQVSAVSSHRQEEQRQRAASVGILESMATIDKDPQIADLATWVKAGGDPQFALGYALAEDRHDAARTKAVAILENMSERENDPTLYELARWVSAGGDEKFALNRALGQKRENPQRADRRNYSPTESPFIPEGQRWSASFCPSSLGSRQ